MWANIRIAGRSWGSVRARLASGGGTPREVDPGFAAKGMKPDHCEADAREIGRSPKRALRGPAD